MPGDGDKRGGDLRGGEQDSDRAGGLPAPGDHMARVSNAGRLRGGDIVAAERADSDRGWPSGAVAIPLRRCAHGGLWSGCERAVAVADGGRMPGDGDERRGDLCGGEQDGDRAGSLPAPGDHMARVSNAGRLRRGDLVAAGRADGDGGRPPGAVAIPLRRDASRGLRSEPERAAAVADGGRVPGDGDERRGNLCRGEQDGDRAGGDAAEAGDQLARISV